MENESDDKNDGSTPIQVTKLWSNIELQESLKEIGTSPAVSIARDQDFSVKMENKAARYQHSSSFRASSDELPANCTVYDAQQAGNSSRMKLLYIYMHQT
eukprot:1914694-Ditylum_brightwellii.AAC.1